MTTESQPLRSLQELCEIQLQDNVLKSDTADDEFASLEPRFQLLLFDRLRTEHARLTSMTEQLEEFSWRMPVVDRQLSLGTSTNTSNALEFDTDRVLHRIIWSYVPSEGPDRHYHARRDDDFKQWSDRVLRAGLPDTKFIICPHHILAWSCECKLPKVCLCERISSQLLLYRISATFGMPPAEECDGYKSCWDACLHHEDGYSTVSFGDSKGGSTVKYYGTNKASDDALNLLNYLVGPTFPSGNGKVTPSEA
jgi:hypothetical protein